MEIEGKVHCFFEQSGVFKNEFIKLGIPAEDYDIQNNFKQTDNVIDLFAEIEKAYIGNKSVFDDITNKDLIIAFFPCIYFENVQMLFFSLEDINYRNETLCKRIEYAIERLHKRTYFHEVLYKLLSVTNKKNIPLIIENPYSKSGYLTGVQNFPKPKIIDNNRQMKGDYFVKPTAYWFFGIEPTKGNTIQITPIEKRKIVNKCRKGEKAGICSEERSLISPDYARNFICDFIIGKKQDIGQLSLF